MGNPALGYLIVALVVVAIWWAFRPRPLFRVRIRNGQAEVLVGVVTPACIEQLEAVCRANEISQAELWGFLPPGGRLHLTFSHHFPPGARQQLRNFWIEQTWTGPPSAPPPSSSSQHVAL